MTRRTDTYTAVTPFGAVEVDFPEEGGCILDGAVEAVDYLKSVMAKSVNGMGMSITPDNLEPVDFMDFCQPKGSGILIIEPLDELLHYGPHQGAEAVLDSAVMSPLARIKLNAELAEKSRQLSDAKSPIQRARLAKEVGELLGQFSVATPKDPNMGRKWNSAWGAATVTGLFSVAKPEYGMKALYEITYEEGQYLRVYEDKIDAQIAKDEYSATPEGIEAKKVQRETYERQAIEIANEEERIKRQKEDQQGRLDGFIQASGYSAIRVGQARKALTAPVRHEGRVMASFEFVDALVALGLPIKSEEVDRIQPMNSRAYNRADNREQEAHEKRIRDGGKKTVYTLGGYGIGAFEYAYANYLIEKIAKSPPHLPQPQEKLNGDEATQALETEAQRPQAPTSSNVASLDAVTIPDDELEAEDLSDVEVPEAATENATDTDAPTLDSALSLSQIRERAAIDRELLAMGMVPEDGYLERTYGAGWKMGAVRRAPVLDDASMNQVPPVDPTITALAAMAGRMAAMVEAQNATILSALNAKPAPIELTLKNEPMTVKIEQPASVVNITNEVPQAAPVTVNIPEQAAPVVNVSAPVTVQPAPVTVNNAFASQAVQTVERDANDEIVRTVTEYK